MVQRLQVNGSASRSPIAKCSTSAQCLQDINLVGILEGRIQPPYLLAVDEDLHVWADRILLVNHSKANARELTIQIIQHFSDGRTIRVNIVPLIRVRQQWTWNVDFHIASEGFEPRRIEDRGSKIKDRT